VTVVSEKDLTVGCKRVRLSSRDYLWVRLSDVKTAYPSRNHILAVISQRIGQRLNNIQSEILQISSDQILFNFPKHCFY
jgi:hypothetical protein